MAINKEHIAKVIELFVVKEKRPRFLEFISSPNGWDGLPKRYDDFLHELLNDPRNLEPKCIAEDLGGKHELPEIIEKLRKLGAGKQAYLISGTSEHDGKIGNLEEIISHAYGGEIVYCLGTKLGYYEGHENWRYILRAP